MKSKPPINFPFPAFRIILSHIWMSFKHVIVSSWPLLLPFSFLWTHLLELCCFSNLNFLIDHLSARCTVTCPVALFTKILTIKNCRKCKTKIKKSFTKILTIILSVKIVLTLCVKLPCSKCEILVLSFIVSEKNRKKDGRCIGTSTWK